MVARAPYALRDATPPGVLADLADALDVERDEGGWRCPSPGHDDDHASAGVFLATQLDPPHGRWKCQACGCGGDALDLVKRMTGLDFGAAIEWLADWLESDAAARLPSPTGRGKTGKGLDVESIRRHCQRRSTAAGLARAWLCEHKGLDVDPDWLAWAFRLGASRQGSLVLPYWTASGEKEPGGRIVGASLRWSPWSEHRVMDGSQRAGVLYGEWRDVGQPKVVLCEGESDALAVAWWLRRRERILVLGVPGAGSKPTPRVCAALADRKVVLLPDGDAAGQGWAAHWADALADAGAATAVAALPAGADACLAGQRAVWTALRDAQPMREPRQRGDATGALNAHSRTQKEKGASRRKGWSC